ncbi:hypothetical protein, partial [Rubritalea profundi]|uniref:hypothetical protein n=1 Tax=Rubritalea profundi TaxID=1658618 RepID=UPI0013FE1198
DWEAFARFVVPGKVVGDAEKRLLKILQVQVDVQFLQLDLVLPAAGMGVSFAPEAVGADIDKLNAGIAVVAFGIGS